MRLKLSPNGNLYIRDGRLLFGPEGECCCNDAVCSLDGVPTIHPIECNETMDSIGGLTINSTTTPLFVGSMQAPTSSSNVSVRKDMSIDLLTFTTLDIRHSSFVSDEPTSGFDASTTVVQYANQFPNTGFSNSLVYRVTHSDSNPLISGVSNTPRHSYAFGFGPALLSSGGFVESEGEVDFRGLLTVNSRTFEEIPFGSNMLCIMRLEGTIEFFINGVLEQSADFITLYEQSRISIGTNNSDLRGSVNVDGTADPTDQGIDSIQVIIT